jgi:hypothetical protein
MSSRTGTALLAPADQLADAQVVGAEVVSPRGHAVRLVHGHERGWAAPQRVGHIVGYQLLGREEREVELPTAQRLDRLPSLRRAARRADPSRANGSAVVLPAVQQRLLLVLLQCQQR